MAASSWRYWMLATLLFGCTTSNLCPLAANEPAAAPEPAAAQKAEAEFELGNESQRREDFEKAVEHYTAAIRLRPGYTAAFRNRSIVNKSRGKFREAIEDINQFQRLDDLGRPAIFGRNSVQEMIDHQEMFVYRAELYIVVSEYEKAFQDCYFALKVGPRNIRSLSTLAIACENLQKYDLALQALSAAIQIEPKSSDLFLHRAKIYWLKNESDPAIKDFTEAIRLAPTTQWEAYCGRGCTLASLGKLELALNDLNQAIEINPQKSSLFFNRGQVFELGKQSDKAITDYSSALRLDAESTQSLLARGEIYQQQGKLELALADYNEAIRFDPQAAEGYVGRGGCYLRQSKFRLAAADFTEAIRTQSKNQSALIGRAICCYKTGQFDSAVVDFTEAIRLGASSEQVYLGLSLCHFELKQYDLAMDSLTETIRRYPQCVQGYLGRGACHYHLKELDLALGDLTQALLLNPQNDTAHQFRGCCYLDQREYERAITDLTETIRIDPSCPSTFAIRSRAYFLSDKQDLALADLKEAWRLWMAGSMTTWHSHLAAIPWNKVLR